MEWPVINMYFVLSYCLLHLVNNLFYSQVHVKPKPLAYFAAVYTHFMVYIKE